MKTFLPAFPALFSLLRETILCALGVQLPVYDVPILCVYTLRERSAFWGHSSRKTLDIRKNSDELNKKVFAQYFSEKKSDKKYAIFRANMHEALLVSHENICLMLSGNFFCYINKGTFDLYKKAHEKPNYCWLPHKSTFSCIRNIICWIGRWKSFESYGGCYCIISTEYCSSTFSCLCDGYTKSCVRISFMNAFNRIVIFNSQNKIVACFYSIYDFEQWKWFMGLLNYVCKWLFKTVFIGLNHERAWRLS